MSETASEEEEEEEEMEQEKSINKQSGEKNKIGEKKRAQKVKEANNCVFVTYLAVGKQGQANRAFFRQHTTDEVTVMWLAHGLYHVLQRVGGTRVTQQRQG